MNYFELFEIPVQLSVDTSVLTKRFFELSKKFHPDYFIGEQETAQLEALEKSAMLNKAWKVFQRREETIKYVLQIKGLLEEEEKYELPPDFLMEVLEINEQLMDDPDAAGIENQVNRLQNEIYEPVKDIVENYKDGITTEKELLQVKDYYYKKKYLDRIYRELAAKSG
jgi:molecular chaperone HscB